jgi:hypothetical protein
MFFWFDMKGISKYYGAMEPRQVVTQQTYVGHFWRSVNSNTNQTIGGYCGIPDHIDIIIKDEDVMVVEGNRQYLQSAIKGLNLWSTPSDALREESRPSLAVDDDWVTGDSEKRLIWLLNEHRPTRSIINLNTHRLRINFPFCWFCFSI